MYKGLLDRQSLRAADGVKYFKNTLGPHFTRRVQNVFTWRCFFLFRARRENMEMVKWNDFFSLLLKRLKDSWMDVLPSNNRSETRRQKISFMLMWPEGVKKNEAEVQNF